MIWVIYKGVGVVCDGRKWVPGNMLQLSPTLDSLMGVLEWQWMKGADRNALTNNRLMKDLTVVCLSPKKQIPAKLVTCLLGALPFVFFPVIHVFRGLTWSWHFQSSWSWSFPSGAHGPWLLQSQASSQTEPFSVSLVWHWQPWHLQMDEGLSWHPSSSFYSPCLPFASFTYKKHQCGLISLTSRA